MVKHKHFKNIFKNFKLVPLRQSPYVTRNTENIPLFKTKQNFFKNSFFPSVVIEWNNLDHNIRNVGSFSAFKNNILKFIRPTPNNAFNFENLRGIKLITRLRVGIAIYVNTNSSIVFKIFLFPICSCGFDIEATSHYFLHCPMYNGERDTLLSTIKNIDCRLLDVTKTVLINLIWNA